MKSAVRVTILVDNVAGQGLMGEHGFSAWIEAGGLRLLFDTGQGPALRHNAAALGIPLSSADCLVLSHGHYDHTGGLPLALKNAPTARVHGAPQMARERYSLRGGQAHAIGMPGEARDVLERLAPEQLQQTTGPVEIGDGVGLTGPIPRQTGWEDTGGPFFVDEDGKHPDPIPDDLACWFATDLGLVVVVGCSHAGLINTLHHARSLGGGGRIHAVLGGFHLLAASESRLVRTVEALAELAPDLIVPCHCTGELATARLVEALGARVVSGAAGQTYTLGVRRDPHKQ